MYRHVVLFRFAPEATAEQREAVLTGLRSLPAQIPELVEYRVGPNDGTAEQNFDFAVVADFAEPEHFDVYLQHPAHEAVAAELIRPIITERAAVQYEV
jgi:hypothetical protein